MQRRRRGSITSSAGIPGTIVVVLGHQFPEVAAMSPDAALAAFAKPLEEIWSTKRLQRLNKELKRRTDVVSVIPNPAA